MMLLPSMVTSEAACWPMMKFQSSRVECATFVSGETACHGSQWSDSMQESFQLPHCCRRPKGETALKLYHT